MTRARRAFTLIELLVVVAILALLAAIISPSLRRAQDLARQSVCGSNLHQYGVAIHNHRSDHDLKIMRMVHQWGNRPYPDYIRRDNTARAEWENEWAIEQIDPYLDSFDMANENVEGISMCPAIEADIMNRFIQVRNFGWTMGGNYQFMEYQYTYWGGVDRSNQTWIRNGAREELADTFLRQPGLLMSDIVYYDASDFGTNRGGWRYNHGPKGWAFNEYTWMPNDLGDYPNISGTNQLYGDGRVEWKPRGDFKYLHLMQSPNGYPDGYVGGGDTCYY